jgi:hypothetical protein
MNLDCVADVGGKLCFTNADMGRAVRLAPPFGEAGRLALPIARQITIKFKILNLKLKIRNSSHVTHIPSNAAHTGRLSTGNRYPAQTPAKKSAVTASSADCPLNGMSLLKMRICICFLVHG